MSFQVHIRQANTTIAVDYGQTILAAALQAGLPFPNSCQSGNCGACKCKLYAGEVEMSPYSEFALAPAEAADGKILACRAVPWSDCEVAWLADEEVAIHPQRDMVTEVTSITDATHDIRIITLKVLSGGPYVFSSGQYANLEFPGLPPRSYSMANTPDEELLEFHVRLVPGGVVSTHVLHGLTVGERVRVTGPAGSAFWREKHEGPMLAVAGGSGLAPIKSIITAALKQNPDRQIHFYFGVRDERDLYLENYFTDLAARHAHFSFTPVLSDPTGSTTRRTGLVTEAVKSDFTDLAGFKVYLCGPPPMVEAAQRLALNLGAGDENVHADAFYTTADTAKLEASA
jgi:ferredoxin-NAD(P)+ reductase (naphthalene dioxygenase ferredoxin-specific)